MKKSRNANFHFERAATWQTRYLLHATGGKPGRAENAKRMYNYHMRKFSELLAQNLQLTLIP